MIVAEFFSLRSRTAAARARSYSPSDAGFAEFQLGLRALRDGVQTASAHGGAETALLVVRSATRLLVRAAALRGQHVAEDADWAEVWAFATKQPQWSVVESAFSKADMARVVGVLESDDERLVAALGPGERSAVLAAMIFYAKVVAAPLEDDALALRRVLRKKWRRAFLAGFVVSLPILWLALAKKPNLALHKHVVVSDREPTYGVDPQQLVDGNRTNLGFHTSNRMNTTVTIDLGSVRPITRVDVYNRADCCQDRAVPVALQLSNDGQDYRLIAANNRIFDQWSVPMPSKTSARFVRLVHGASTPFHLSEVEVY